MRKRHSFSSRILPLFAGAMLLAACGMDNDDVESQRFTVTVENVGTAYDYYDSGVAAIPSGETEPGPLLPGHSFTFSIHAGIGHRLSFATMFAQSNDLFYAPDEQGIALYDMDGAPREGNVTDEVYLWDAGTEINQEPGSGLNQAPRQGMTDDGAADPNDAVRLAEDSYDNLPAVSEVISLTLSYAGDDTFLVTLTNVSDSSTLVYTGGTSAVPVTPVLWVIHSADAPLFTVGAPDRGEGLEHLAEDGDPSALADTVASRAGYVSPLSPGVWTVSSGSDALFTVGATDRGDGLEQQAEDGDPSMLAAALDPDQSGVFSVPDGDMEAGPLFPGHTFSFEISGRPGDRLFLTTMLGQSNDLFFGPDGQGIALFDMDGMPISGDVTSAISLWDAGTEVNQRPGTGSDQAPRQGMADTGTDEMGVVQRVDDGYEYPPVNALIRVTVTPIQ